MRVWNAVLGFSLKNDKIISIHFQGKPFNITVTQVYAPTSNAKEAEVEWFYEDLQELLELTPKRVVFLIIGDCNEKVGSQEIPGIIDKFGLGVSIEWSRSKAKRVLPRELTGHSKHPLLLFLKFIFISCRLITLQYCIGFCHTLTWISHGFTCVPHSNLPSHLPLHPIPLGLPSAPGQSTCLMHPTWAGDLFLPR